MRWLCSFVAALCFAIAANVHAQPALKRVPAPDVPAKPVKRAAPEPVAVVLADFDSDPKYRNIGPPFHGETLSLPITMRNITVLRGDVKLPAVIEGTAIYNGISPTHHTPTRALAMLYKNDEGYSVSDRSFTPLRRSGSGYLIRPNVPSTVPLPCKVMVGIGFPVDPPIPTTAAVRDATMPFDEAKLRSELQSYNPQLNEMSCNRPKSWDAYGMRFPDEKWQRSGADNACNIVVAVDRNGQVMSASVTTDAPDEEMLAHCKGMAKFGTYAFSPGLNAGESRSAKYRAEFSRVGGGRVTIIPEHPNGNTYYSLAAEGRDYTFRPMVLVDPNGKVLALSPDGIEEAQWANAVRINYASPALRVDCRDVLNNLCAADAVQQLTVGKSADFAVRVRSFRDFLDGTVVEVIQGGKPVWSESVLVAPYEPPAGPVGRY